MPQFSPGQSKNAIVPATVTPGGLSCQLEVFLGPNESTKVATSGLKAFTSTGAQQSVVAPVVMPTAAGTYHVYIDLYAAGYYLAGYQATEDVVIAAPPVDKILETKDALIFDVKGRPFTNVTTEPVSNLSGYYQCLLSGESGQSPYWEGFYEAGTASKILQYLYDVYTPGGDVIQLVTDYVAAHPEWLTSYGRQWWDYHQCSALLGSCRQEEGLIDTAYLAEPISISALGRTISLPLNVQATEDNAWLAYMYAEHMIMGEHYLWLEPQFGAPMPPPAYRGAGGLAYKLIYAYSDSIRYIKGIEFPKSTIGSWSVFGGGYYYPGIYDGRFSLGFYSANLGREYQSQNNFRIRNLVRVTGQGTAQP